MSCSWQYIEPTSAEDPTPIVITLTENEILERYYPWWARQMMNKGFVAGIFPLRCVEDWVVVHWAWRVREETRR